MSIYLVSTCLCTIWPLSTEETAEQQSDVVNLVRNEHMISQFKDPPMRVYYFPFKYEIQVLLDSLVNMTTRITTTRITTRRHMGLGCLTSE